jgi:hypothetical protein
VITFFESHRYNEAISDDQLVDTEKIPDVSEIVSAASQPRQFEVNTQRFRHLSQQLISRVSTGYRFDISVNVSAVDMKKEPDVSETALDEQTETL